MDKFQSGGIFRSMVYKPLPLMPGADPSQLMAQGAPQATGGGSEVEEIIPKELVKDLLGNGITNDVIQFKEEIDSAYNRYSQLSDLEKETQYGKHLRTVMKGDFAKLNHLKRNKEMLDKGIDTVKSKDAESDFAITTRGVIVKDTETGEVGEITHAQYAENNKDGRYQMLTNSQLIHEREYNKNLTFDINSLTALKDSIGITKVKEEVLKVLDKLGKESSSSSQQMLSYGGTARASQGAAALLSQGVDAFFKEGQGQSQTSNAENIKLAISTMWVNLSDNARSLLKARAIARGAKGADIDRVAREDAISILSPSYDVSTSQDYSIDFEGGMTSALKSSKEAADGTGGGPVADVGFWTETTIGSGDPSEIEFQSGTQKITLVGNTAGAIHDYGERIKDGTMLSDIQSLKTVANLDYVTIGDNIIPNEALQNVMYQGQDLAQVRVPVKNVNGKMVPDLKANERYKEVMAKLKEAKAKNPNISAMAQESIIRQHSYTPRKDAQGNIVPTEETAMFYATTALVNSGVINSTEGLNETNSQRRKQYINYYEKGAGDTTGKGEDIIGRESFSGMFSKNKYLGKNVYEGIVFIPLAANDPVLMKNRSLRADGMNTNTSRSNFDTYNASSISNKTGKHISASLNYNNPNIGSKYKND